MIYHDTGSLGIVSFQIDHIEADLFINHLLDKGNLFIGGQRCYVPALLYSHLKRL